MRITAKLIFVFLLLLLAQTASAEWRKQSVNTLAWLRSVHFVDAKTGWIGGSKGTLLKTVDGGDTWIKRPGITSDTIRQIVFADKNHGWLLCERDIYNLGQAESSYLMRTADGGKIWHRVDLENNQRQRITRIFFAKNGFGLAIGETGVLFGLKDDNQTWKKLSLPSTYLMSDGVFLDEFRGTIVGGGGTILFTEDAGITWNRALINGKSSPRFSALYFNGGRVGWAVGSSGSVFQTFNSGRAWRAQKSGTTERLNDVVFLDSAEGWAIGDEGVILHTTTAGNIWQKIDSRSTHKLESIDFNRSNGWIVGFGGTILKYEKGITANLDKPTIRNPQ